MSAARQTTRITIDVEVGSEPISGQVELPGKRTEAFVGWSMLAERLEEARTGMQPPTASQSWASGSSVSGSKPSLSRERS
jgi:hypothetical protein